MKHKLSKLSLAMLSASSLSFASSVYAQEAQIEEDQTIEVIEVTGMRASLTSALASKRDTSNLVEVIDAIDIGKLPDQNLAEVLENITGVQITRRAGVGNGVQIRGTNANRVEINGVSTVGSGAGRSGISFEDVNASIIAGIEVTKSPEAKTVEGSVGGTVNLKTIRPLDLSEMLGSIRVQGEQSSLSTESMTPRLSGAFGDNWETDSGKFGFVISGSYTEQESVSFRPRADRDNLVTAADGSQYQGIQFLVQEQENFDYETTNLAATFEWAPNDNLKFHADAIVNSQERSQDSYRIQASGISNLRNISTPSQLESVNYGSLDGTEIGTYQAAVVGTLEPVFDGSANPSDGNLRFSSDTSSRITDTSVFVFGGEWQGDNLLISAEVSSSRSETYNPNLSTTLNFINPNTPLVVEVRGLNDDLDGYTRYDRVPLMGDITTLEQAVASIEGGVLAESYVYNDNATPFTYDLTGGALAFGIPSASPYAPTAAQLLDPANIRLDQVQVGRDTQDNQEDGFRTDFTYFIDDSIITSVDFGYRYNQSSSEYHRVRDNIGGFGDMVDSPSGTLFEELLVAGPDNYNDADGRDLYISDFLLVDPDRAFSDRDGVVDILQNAVIAHDPDSPDILALESDQNSYYLVEEDSHALYVQANFEYENIRGNVGVRYLDTSVDSTGYLPEDANGLRALETTTGGYSFLLPRLNIVADLTDDVVLRFGYGADVRRADFDNLTTSFRFDSSENTSVELGNPSLEPEEVNSWDLGVEWYFAEAAIASVGFFQKKRTNIFGSDFEGALLLDDGAGGYLRETNPSCPGGGIWNPDVVPNALGDSSTTGLCVDFTQPGNDPETTTQKGLEFAFQYDLSSFEADLGWASGFGVVANYTIQDYSGGSEEDCTSGRGLTVLGDLCIDRGLLDFSEKAYNFTLYYEKHGLSARMRYTWRDAFRTNDFGGGANTSGSSTLSFPVVTAARGQLNASVNYAVTEKLNIGLEAVNLTEERIEQYCVNDNALLCFVGLPDRRVTLGASYRF